MNEIINTFLLTGYTFLPEMHLSHSRFTYSACGAFNISKERVP